MLSPEAWSYSISSTFSSDAIDTTDNSLYQVRFLRLVNSGFSRSSREWSLAAHKITNERKAAYFNKPEERSCSASSTFSSDPMDTTDNSLYQVRFLRLVNSGFSCSSREWSLAAHKITYERKALRRNSPKGGSVLLPPRSLLTL